MKGSVRLPIFIDDARKYVNTTQLRAKYLGASYEAEYCQWQTLHGLGSLMETASLIITPNAFLEGKLIASYPPDPIGDFDVVRATTATRVNSAGLVELVPYNLLSYSEQFDNAYWLKYQANITANNITAPNGTLTADKVVASANGGSVVYVSNSPLISGTYSYSIYAKSGNQDKIYLEAYGVGGSACSTAINLTTQAIISQSGFTNLNIESVGNGWFRISATFSNLGGSSVSVGFGMATSVVTNDFTYFWGGQINEGTLKDYQKTETRLNIPRLDYSNGTCPSLLVEPQRTNLLPYSEQFTISPWLPYNSTLTANTIVAPNGVTSADTLTSNASTGGDVFQLITLNGTYTATAYFKEGNTSSVIIGYSNGVYSTFNLSTQTFVVTGSGTSTIEDAGNGWYRCSLTTSITAGIYVAFSSAATSGKYVYLWGAQLETGAYASSYIPTTTASVTRNYDFLFLGNNYTSGRISASGGTWFTYLINNIPITRDSGGGVGLRLSNTTFNNTLHISTPGGSNQRYWIRKIVGGTNTNLYHTLTNEVKIAIKWNGTTADVFVNGVKVVSATAFTSVNLENLGLDNGNIPYNINSMALWSTPLTDTQLAQLTTI